MKRIVISAQRLREAIHGIAGKRLTGKLEINFSQGTPAGTLAWSSSSDVEPIAEPQRDPVDVALREVNRRYGGDLNAFFADVASHQSVAVDKTP